MVRSDRTNRCVAVPNHWFTSPGKTYLLSPIDGPGLVVVQKRPGKLGVVISGPYVNAARERRRAQSRCPQAICTSRPQPHGFVLRALAQINQSLSLLIKTLLIRCGAVPNHQKPRLLRIRLTNTKPWSYAWALDSWASKRVPPL